MKTILTIASLFVPLPIACVPFITHTYGLAGAWCWIKATDADCSKLEAGVTEQFTLWYGPLFVLSILEIIIVITCNLCKRAWSYDRENCDPLLPRQNRRAVLKEVLPLIACPIIFTHYAGSHWQIDYKLLNKVGCLLLGWSKPLPPQPWTWLLLPLCWYTCKCWVSQNVKYHEK